MPAGHALQGSVHEPVKNVPTGSWKAIGKALSVPPLNGVGVLDNETNSIVNVNGAALLSMSEPNDPTSSVPAPTSSGTPPRPARPPPSLAHGWIGWNT